MSHYRWSPTYKSNQIVKTSFEFHLAKDIPIENADYKDVPYGKNTLRRKVRSEKQATPAYSFSLIEESG